MKKIIASAVGLMMAGGIAATTASAAVENQFGGYWRTRVFVQDEFRQEGSSYYRADNRTRLFYTAKFNDDFKFVNKFEFNSLWGDNNGGDLGADGDTWVVKNSYADFNVGPVNAKLGIQDVVIARGIIADTDFSGAIITPKFGNVSVPLVYAAVSNGDLGASADIPDTDANLWAALVVVEVSKDVKVVPYGVLYSADGDTDVFYLGADADVKFGAVSLWGTGIFNGGEVAGVDKEAFLVAAGANAGIVHGQAFYSTGDDGDDADQNDAFFTAADLNSYYWSEIMGLGVFDNRASSGAPGDKISNIWAGNAGVTFKPMDKLKIDADVWYAQLAEENAAGDDELGVEFDGKLTYTIMENLTAEGIFAYLISGDATGDEDVIEGGVRVSLKF